MDTEKSMEKQAMTASKLKGSQVRHSNCLHFLQLLNMESSPMNKSLAHQFSSCNVVVAKATQPSMSQGLARSENPVALHLANQVGFNRVITFARKLGITTPLEANSSMVLGGNEALLYEMAQAYAVVANGGQAITLKGVNKIYDLTICRSEEALDECHPHGVHTPIPQQKRQLISPANARAMDTMLLRAVHEGTGRNAAVVADARGKTGTTNNGRDAWFIGYSPRQRILTGIWMGNDDNTAAEAASGSMAARLWGQYMKEI